MILYPIYILHLYFLKCKSFHYYIYTDSMYATYAEPYIDVFASVVHFFLKGNRNLNKFIFEEPIRF